MRATCHRAERVSLYLLLDQDRAASLSVLWELVIFQVALAIARNLFVPALAAQAMGTPALVELSCRIGATVIALVLILRRTPISFPVALLSFPIAGAVLVTLAYRNSVHHGATWRIDPRWSVLRDTWKRTAHFAGSETLSQFYARTDLLLIAYFLGQEHVGLYATDIKFVEVGIVPLVYVGVAVYPILVAMADGPAARFISAARDLCRVQLMLSGWLAVGIVLLIPMLIVPCLAPVSRLRLLCFHGSLYSRWSRAVKSRCIGCCIRCVGSPCISVAWPSAPS